MWCNDTCGHLFMHSSLKFPPWCFDQVKVFFFSNSVIELLLYLGSLSYCTSQIGPSLSCQTDGLKFDLIWSQRSSVAAKQPKSSPLHYRAWKIRIGFLCWYTVFGFSYTVVLYIISKQLHFGLICPKDIVPELACSNVTLQSHTAIFRQGFLLETQP